MGETFTFLSQFAQSWALAGMAVFFVLAVAWVFLPFNRGTYDVAANSIFRDDKSPGAKGPDETKGA